MTNTAKTYARLYRLKLLATAAMLVVVGLVATLVGNWLTDQRAAHLLITLVQALADVLIVTGGFGIALDFFTSRDRDAKDDERVRRLLDEAAPAFRDAVIAGFAETPEHMRAVATPETLDRLATNALTLRLGDEQFAREIYADVRDQAIRAPERWYDVEAKVRLSAVPGPEGTTPRFEVLVQWEYTVTPSHPVARFACVSDREEFYELTTDIPATSTWFMTPRLGFEASSRDNFELLSFSVDGDEKRIRRSERKSGQTYTVALGDELVTAQKPARVRHVYRTVAAKSNHNLFLEVAQPARDVSMEIDYTATDISRLTVSDLVTSIHKPRIARMPAATAAKVVQVDIPGWLLPRAGFTCVWTLASEESDQPAQRVVRPVSQRITR